MTRFLLAIAGAKNGQTLALPSDTARVIRFETREGTWMSVDVSPDGRTLVFDLLGHLYLLPAHGGRARPLTSGPSWDKQARFAPDGRRIAYISDAGGFDNLWLMNLDGSDARQLSHVWRGAFANTSISSPAWAPDGRSVIVAQRRGSVEPMPSSEHANRWLLAAYNVASSQWRWISDTAIARARGALGPVLTPDGQAIYAAAEPPAWTSEERAWRIERIRLTDGTMVPELPPWQGRLGMRPAVSPNGRFLTYVTPNGSELGLRLRDLNTLNERWLVPHGLDWGAWARRGTRGMHSDLAPGYAFSPDGRAVIIGYGGRIHCVDVRNGASTQIPFVARVDRELAPMTLHQFTLPDTAVRTRAVDQPALSPDGLRVAFSALGRIWIMDLPPEGGLEGRPWRLTTDTAGEFYPSWSPNGKWIVYSTWQDGTGGTIRRAWVDDRTRPPELLSADTALYFHTAVTQNGKAVLAARSELPAGGIIDYSFRWMPPVHLIRLTLTPSSVADLTDLSGGTGTASSMEPRPREVARFPIEQLYLAGVDSEEIHVGLSSLGTGGRGWRDVVTIADPSYRGLLVTDITGVLSPSRQRALVTRGGQLSQVWLPAGVQNQPQDTFDLDGAYDRPFGSAAGAARRWGYALSPWISWSRNGRRVLFVQGGTFFVGEVPDRGWITFTRIDVPLRVPVDVPEGTIVLRGARAITMAGESERETRAPVIIESADIVVRGNRIAAIGRSGRVRFPQNAVVWDVTGKTILPGYVDIHDHQAAPPGIHPQQWWGWLVRLAHGVTAIRDPSESWGTYNGIFAYREEERAGALSGPRLFSTGVAHYGLMHPDTITAEEASAVVKPYADYLGTETFKEYTGRLTATGRRRMASAAASAGLNGTIHWEFPLQAISEGFSGVEHSLQMASYDDVLTFIARSGVTQTETFSVTASAQGSLLTSGTEPWACPLMRRFVSPENRAQQTTDWLAFQDMIGHPEASYLLPRFRSAAGVVARGGRIAVGSHGGIPGMGFHYELRFYALGGMPPFAILRAATIEGARAIGHAKDLGSLEVGKLADLQVLDNNPLGDIKNTTSIRYVMKNGRLYQAADLTELWPRHFPLNPIYLFGRDSARVMQRQ